MTERPLIDEILLSASRLGSRLFRQNVGLGWVGKIIRRDRTKILLENPRPLHAGLCKGSSDVVGLTPVVITPDMVGKTVGVFTAIEVKYGRTPTDDDQKKFIAMVKKLGGIAAIVRSLDDYHKALKQWRPQ